MKTDVKSAERESSTTPRETSESGERRPMREDDLLRFQWDADPRMAPDGARVASPRVWIDAVLDAPDRKKPTNEPARVIRKPVFRENGRGFYDDQRKDHVWVIERAGGAPRALTVGGFAESGPRWSRDGRWILFTSDRRPEPWFGPEESKLWAVSPDLETPTEGDALMLAVDAPGAVVAWTEGVDGTIAWIGTRFAD